jgi:hypothetical protein
MRLALQVTGSENFRLETRNAKLKKLLADTMLDELKDLLAKKMVTPAAKREAVAHLRPAFDMSNPEPRDRHLTFSTSQSQAGVAAHSHNFRTCGMHTDWVFFIDGFDSEDFWVKCTSPVLVSSTSFRKKKWN